MKKVDFLQLLARKLTDGLERKAEQQLKDALADNAYYKRQYDILTRYFQARRRPDMAARIRLASAWQAIEAAEVKSNPVPGTDDGQGVPVMRRATWGMSLRAAAVILCCAATVALVYRAVQTVSAPEFVEIQTDNSQRFVTLADGTFVVLNEESTLRYNADFGVDDRLIDLRGAAYFEVARNEKIPLVVNAGGMRVEVKGTTFQVSAYDDAPTASVSLIDGSVEVSASGDGSATRSGAVLLKPMQRFELVRRRSAVPRVVSFQKDSLMAELGWWPAPDSLSFHNERLESVLRKLSKKFKVQIVVRNPQVKDIRISGALSEDVTLEKALEVLQIAYPLNYQVKGNEVIVE